MDIQRFAVDHVHNRFADRERPYGDEQRRAVSVAAFANARTEIAAWPGYRPTPLVHLEGLASTLDLKRIVYKDESRRFGLKSFKALGGAYAVLRVLGEKIARENGGMPVTTADLIAARYRETTSGETFAAATDGNHGRSVAWGAQMFGASCRIYLHAHVSAAREAEIARYGATIVRVEGSYDDSVRVCASEAAANGWHLVADTNSGGGDALIPALVMQGYTVMVQEILDQMQGRAISHVFVQCGVGGLAAAIAGHLWELQGPARPSIVVVEPAKADCVFRSIAAGEPTVVPGDANTFMACLAAAEISPLVWPILKYAVDDVLSLPEDAAPAAMRLLAQGVGDDRPLVSGESGCAGIAGLIAAGLDPALRTKLGLGADATVVVIGSEGATDAETYAQVVGESAEEVEARAA